MKNNHRASHEADHQTVPLIVEGKAGAQSIQMGFTNQRLTPHGGLVLNEFVFGQLGWRPHLEAAMP